MPSAATPRLSASLIAVNGQDTDVESLQGQLLVAAPGLLDPNFFRTVVLITEHTEEGAAAGVTRDRPHAGLDVVVDVAWRGGDEADRADAFDEPVFVERLRVVERH